MVLIMQRKSGKLGKFTGEAVLGYLINLTGYKLQMIKKYH